MLTSGRMCESDKVFVFSSTIYVHVNLCGWKCVWTFALILEFYVIIFLFVSPFMRSHVFACMYVRMPVCAAVIEAVLQHTVWCLQPESCHKQSAPASVKQKAWENWVLYRLQPAPRSLNRPTHLPNALKSKWAMDIPHDIGIVMRQQVGEDLPWQWPVTLEGVELWHWVKLKSILCYTVETGRVWICSCRKCSFFRFKWFHTSWMWWGCCNVW